MISGHTSIRFKKLDPAAVTPKRAHPDDAGLDLVAIGRRWSEPSQTWVYGTGLAVEIPPGFVGLLFMRSSVVNKPGTLKNAVGVIDAGYRGELSMHFSPTEGSFSIATDYYKPFEKVGQLVIVPCLLCEAIEADELSPSARGEKGYGSSGT
jgi:dUTP pyrophosphatase